MIRSDKTESDSFWYLKNKPDDSDNREQHVEKELEWIEYQTRGCDSNVNLIDIVYFIKTKKKSWNNHVREVENLLKYIQSL